MLFFTNINIMLPLLLAVTFADEPLRMIVLRMAETGLTRFPVVARRDGTLVGMVGLADPHRQGPDSRSGTAAGAHAGYPAADARSARSRARRLNGARARPRREPH